MTEDNSVNYGSHYINAWYQAVKDGEFEKAMEIAAKGYLVSKDLMDIKLHIEFKELLENSCWPFNVQKQLINKESKSPICCSFCGKEESEVKKIIGGAGASICDQCVLLCLKVLEDKN